MLTASVTPSIATTNCRQVGEAASWIYQIYEQDRPISDVMDVIDSRGFKGLTKEQSRKLALDVHKLMSRSIFLSIIDARDFFERRCFEEKYN